MDYKVARIVNTYGIKGQLKIIAETDFMDERFSEGNRLSIVRDDQRLADVHVSNIFQHKGSYIVTFQEFNNINQVEQFKGAWLTINKGQQLELDEDEFYHHQIIGLNVQTTEGQLLGKIKEILQLGSNDVWVVQRKESGKRDVLIPYIDDVVKEVNLNQQYVAIDLLEGLVDDEN